MTPRAVTLAAKDLKGEALAQAFLIALRVAGVHAPVREHRFAVEATGRRWQFDYCWPDEMVALEVEGGAFKKGGGRHTRGAGFREDLAKYNAATMLDWRLLRVMPEQLCDPETIRNIRHLLAVRA